MAKLTNEELLDAFKEMTLLELSEFVKQFEDTFGVTAAAPVAVAAAGAAPAAVEEAAEEESSEVDVILESIGDKKIHLARTQGGQGSRRVRAQGRPRERAARRGRQGAGGPRGRRRNRHPQVTAG